MVEESPQTPAPHRRSLLAGLLSFIPALALYASSLLSAHPVVVLALLAGSAWMLTAICAGIGFAMERDFLRSVIRRGSVSFFMLVLHTSFMALVLAGPVWWLLDEPSLLGALLLSAALLVALLVPWRIWPALTWPLIVDEVHAEAASPGAVLRRSFASALQLTDEHELFFSHGLLSSLAMFLVCAGALVIALFLPAFSFEMRLSAAVLYALVLVPLASLVLVTRCMSAIALDARVRRSGSRKEIAETQTPAPVLVADLGVFDASVALLAAARSGNVELALAALERGANPEAAPLADDRDQRSALIHAVLLPDLRLLRALIGRGVDLNHGHSGLSPLLAASRDSLQGRPEAVMTLLANGADPDVVDAALNTPLHHAALCSEPIVAALLLDAGTRINAVNRDGMTALGIACANANWTLATFLLDRGALAEVEHAQPAILLAASTAEDDADGVRLLLKRKHKVDARGLLDRTALMAAALAGHQAVVHLLRALATIPTATRLDLAPRLPPISGDSSQLRQVILNLLSNAHDAIARMPPHPAAPAGAPGDEPGRVQVRTRRVDLRPSDLGTLLLGEGMRPGPAVLLEVIDNGTGMEAETLERLWEPFFTTKERGRGLGLPSVLGILRAHHAGIALESHPRAGTQFRVYFSEDPASEPQGRSMPG